MIKPKKSLGQNFLIDQEILNLIVNLTSIKSKSVLEIGPGTGNLTSLIIEKKPKEFCVIEKDNDLAKKLTSNYKNKIKVINEDILKIQENLLFSEKIKVFGNLPYNISTEILSKWIIGLRNNFWFDCLILMFQKEVADRILAKKNSKEFGRLSILCNWRTEVKKKFDVSCNCFYPKPKIDSTILSFYPKKNIKYKIKNPKNLEFITRILFSSRRKMINKNLNKLFTKNNSLIKDLNLNLRCRPEELSNEMFYKIAIKYEKLTD